MAPTSVGGLCPHRPDVARCCAWRSSSFRSDVRQALCAGIGGRTVGWFVLAATGHEGELMLDTVLRGGTVVDGTGRARRRADVAMRNGRIVEVGTVDEPAVRTIDVSGLVVSPGVI